jgi:hypothetical protein
MVSKPHLMLDSCVAIRCKMLTYYVYAPLLNRIGALLSSLIWSSETISRAVVTFLFLAKNRFLIRKCLLF